MVVVVVAADAMKHLLIRIYNYFALCCIPLVGRARHYYCYDYYCSVAVFVVGDVEAKPLWSRPYFHLSYKQQQPY